MVPASCCPSGLTENPFESGVKPVDQEEKHKYCTNRLIALANELKDEDIDPTLVSGALMTASAVYATYVASGNEGGLEESGLDKVVALYRRTLEHYQNVRKQDQASGKTTH
jgi:hypothetical protein